MPKSIHTIKINGKWAVKASKTGKPISIHLTQATAIEAGRKVAKREHAEHVIHDKDGGIQRKNSYGNDPRDIKG